jgi:hypothetical protein
MEMVTGPNHQDQNHANDLNLLSAFGHGFAKPFGDVLHGVEQIAGYEAQRTPAATDTGSIAETAGSFAGNAALFIGTTALLRRLPRVGGAVAPTLAGAAIGFVSPVQNAEGVGTRLAQAGIGAGTVALLHGGSTMMFRAGAVEPLGNALLKSAALSGAVGGLNVQADSLLHTGRVAGLGDTMFGAASWAAVGVTGHAAGRGIGRLMGSAEGNASHGAAGPRESSHPALANEIRTVGTVPPVDVPHSPVDLFDQTHYKVVPARNLVIDIRTAKGPWMTTAAAGAESKIVGDAAGKINHLVFAQDTTPTQRASLMMAAGFARLVETDALARDAAQSSTLRGRLGLASMQHTIDQAISGAQDYVQGRSGNNFEEYLVKRYGPMTPETHVWAEHILTDPQSPHSGWNPLFVPATESLLAAGKAPVLDLRAAATNPTILAMAPEQRGAAIEAVAKYARQVVDQMLPNAADAHPMVRDAMMGRIAPVISPAEVNAALALELERPGQLVSADTVRARAQSNAAQFAASATDLNAGG